MGHVPTQPLDKKNSWLPAIKSAIAKGIFVGFAPQTLYGRLDPFVYRNARLMHQAGVCYLEDMLPEVAYTKLGWALAHSKSLEETKKLMITNVAGEVTKKISPGAFLY